ISADNFSNIVGGGPVDITRYPYQARLENNHGYLWCGASILTEFHVLSAAHCMLRARGPLTVHTGTSLLSQRGSVHHIAHYAVFGSSRDSDLAVIRVTEAIIFSAVARPIPLAPVNGEPSPGTMAVVTGWGLTSESSRPSNALKATNIQIISREVCSRIYTRPPIGPITLGEICAGNLHGGTDACQGDSGGPLVVNGRQVGIISMGYGCARPNKPGVYTNIAYYNQWITEQLSK
ncbi:PREDICTED: trypsin-1-like, partial [Ceratosolen solmsi marchali]|uniref:Trypsin-1-like n=1 Tax=Ceratosolen solmsi marchali TaxID=326594 RepID=A0AAJ6YQC2_9HYME